MILRTAKVGLKNRKQADKIMGDHRIEKGSKA